MLTLLLATRNKGKVLELRSLLRDLPLQLATPEGLALVVSAPETGSSYAENASLKALAHARASGLWSLGDDTGLEVEALGGAPGIRSARLVGDGGRDADRRRRLLELLADHPRPWPARFRCALVLADPSGRVELAEGVCEGEILPEARGKGGFGYDPLFLVQGGNKTMAELSLREKNRVSHRANAFYSLLPQLKARLAI